MSLSNTYDQLIDVLDYNQNRSMSSLKMTSAHPPPPQYDPADAPAVIVLDTVKDGLLKVKVESDIMAYILYCHYDEFARIQQVSELNTKLK